MSKKKKTKKKQQYNNMQNTQNTAPLYNAEDEYEYVTLGEFLSPVKDKIIHWTSELSVFFICMIILVISMLLLLIGKFSSFVFIVVAVFLLASFSVVILRLAWVKKKEAQKEYERAEMIYNIAMEKKREQNVNGDNE